MARPLFPNAATAAAKLRAVCAIVEKKGGNSKEFLYALGLQSEELEDESSPIGLATYARSIRELEKKYGKDALATLGDELLQDALLGAWAPVLRGADTPARGFERLTFDIEEGRTGRWETLEEKPGGWRGRYQYDHDPALEEGGVLSRARVHELASVPKLFGYENVATQTSGDGREVSVTWSDAAHSTSTKVVFVSAGVLVGIFVWAFVLRAVWVPVSIAALAYGASMWGARRGEAARLARAQAWKMRVLERGLLIADYKSRPLMLGDFSGMHVGGTYRVGRRLGAGASGAVYQATRTSDATPVAIKLLRASAAHDVTSSDRLRREAEALGLAWHPNVVEVLDHGRLADGTSYMVMEYLDGETLGDRLQKKRTLPADVVLTHFEQILSAITAMHEAGVVHRDLKPQNIFLARIAGEERVKILDFGIARVEWEEMRITGTGAPMGTPGYMAPEQKRGEPADGRADLYATGVMLYEALTGNLPSETAIRERSFTGVPAAFTALLERSLAEDVDARFADGREMLSALRAIRKVE
ncbi:MAG: serine/threonine-protein kinase [Polyangiaceae bacterium]